MLRLLPLERFGSTYGKGPAGDRVDCHSVRAKRGASRQEALTLAIAMLIRIVATEY